VVLGYERADMSQRLPCAKENGFLRRTEDVDMTLLSDDQLDAISGGQPDHPWADRQNLTESKIIGATGTWGAGIKNAQFVGGGPDGSLGGQPYHQPGPFDPL
jgi:hypothetical protein